MPKRPRAEPRQATPAAVRAEHGPPDLRNPKPVDPAFRPTRNHPWAPAIRREEMASDGLQYSTRGFRGSPTFGEPHPTLNTHDLITPPKEHEGIKPSPPKRRAIPDTGATAPQGSEGSPMAVPANPHGQPRRPVPRAMDAKPNSGCRVSAPIFIISATFMRSFAYFVIKCCGIRRSTVKNVGFSPAYSIGARFAHGVQRDFQT